MPVTARAAKDGLAMPAETRIFPGTAMHKVNLRDIPEIEQRSPSGKFHSFARNVSLALGGVRNTGLWGGGHPFDVQIRSVPPGAAVCPFHLHLAQWELFVVRTGSGTLRVDDTQHHVRAGDCFIHPPGEAHQLINTDVRDLEVLIVADNPQLDAFHYPDSNKWGLRPPGSFFVLAEADYFQGEDAPDREPAPPAAPFTPTAAPLPGALCPWPIVPFAHRKTSLDALAWETWQSPQGRYRSAGRQVSAALGAKPRTPLTQGGHPFDLEQGRVPPGATVCPFHSHALQWELYLFTAGSGEFRLGEERFPIEPGDAVLARPGVPHTFRNTGPDDLDYFLVADDPAAEFWHYPDSQKFGFSSPRRIFRAVDADYFAGEE